MVAASAAYAIAVLALLSATPAHALDSAIGVGVGASPDYTGSEGGLEASAYNDPLSRFDTPAYITNDYGVIAGAWRRSDLVDPLRVDNWSNVNAAWDTESVAGFAMRNEFSPRTAIGLDVQRGAGLSPGTDPLFLEVGAHYTAPLTESWQAGLRVSSAFGGNDYGVFGGGDGGNRLSGGNGLHNVSVGVGVDYNFARALDFSTFLGYTRAMSDSANAADNNYDENANQFLGGIVVKYKF